jgi:hypothetical protein
MAPMVGHVNCAFSMYNPSESNNGRGGRIEGRKTTTLSTFYISSRSFFSVFLCTYKTSLANFNAPNSYTLMDRLTNLELNLSILNNESLNTKNKIKMYLLDNEASSCSFVGGD